MKESIRNFKRWPANKHDSRVKLGQLVRYSTVDPWIDKPCILLGSSCDCVFFSFCKYLEEVERTKST